MNLCLKEIGQVHKTQYNALECCPNLTTVLDYLTNMIVDFPTTILWSIQCQNHFQCAPQHCLKYSDNLASLKRDVQQRRPYMYKD